MNKLKTSTLSLIIITLTLITINLVCADTVWYDNFNDKEADGWETEVLDWDLSDPFTGEVAEFDMSGGSLKAPGETPGNIWYLATYNSSQDTGTWMFDVNVVDTPWKHFYVFLMTDDWADYPTKAYSYDLVFSTEQGYPEDDSKGAIALFKRDGWRATWDTIGEWSSTEEITGMHNIIVTRDPNGVFDVYLDDERIMQVEDEEPEFGMFSTFRFEASSGPEIDNVVVLDTYDIETAREWSEPVSEPEPEAEPSGDIPGFTSDSIIVGIVIGISFIWISSTKKTSPLFIF